MKKKIIAIFMTAAVLAGSVNSFAETEKGVLKVVKSRVNVENTAADAVENTICELADGEYIACFDTDSSMFHVNEACEGKSVLTVENGEMMIHITLASKNIVNLFPGLAEDAKADGAVWLEPTEDEVTYQDGWKETVFGFDVPVPVLGEEFDLALIGKKGTWYDHKVSVVLAEE